MNLMGVVGWKNVGKMILVVKFVILLVVCGFMVLIVKYVYYVFDIDWEGKDSYKYCIVGVCEVLVIFGVWWVLMYELCDEEEFSLDEYLKVLLLVDIVFVEGFKYYVYLKIEVYR